MSRQLRSLDASPRAAFGATRRIAAAVLAVGVGVGGLTGCTQDQPKPKPTATETGQPDAGITDIVDAPGTGEGLVGALADTETSTCKLVEGKWDVAGTVTNSSDAPASYRIYVSLLNEGGDTRSLTQVNVDPIDPGAETEWSTAVPLEEKNLSCVLRVERYSAADAPAPEDSEG